MVLYSVETLTSLGDVSAEQMETAIYESLAWTNQAFVNSKVSARFNPVHVGRVSANPCARYRGKSGGL